MGGLSVGISAYAQIIRNNHIDRGRVFLGSYPVGQQPASLLEELAQKGQCGATVDLAFRDDMPLPGHYAIWGPRCLARLVGLSRERAAEELMRLYPYQTWRIQ